MRVKFRNQLHNTEATIITKGNSTRLSKTQVSRLRKKLCGCEGCACVAAEYGRDSDGDSYRLVDRYDGTADLEFVE